MNDHWCTVLCHFQKHFSYTLMVNFISWGNPQYSEKTTELTAIVCEKNRIDGNTLRKPPHWLQFSVKTTELTTILWENHLTDRKFISLSILTCINFLQCSRVVFSICPKPQFSVKTMHRTVYNTLRKPPHWPQFSVKTMHRTVYNTLRKPPHWPQCSQETTKLTANKR